MAQNNTPVKALVLAGGGARGSYQVGVWRALTELGWRPQIITGTSVGSLNGAMFALDLYETARDMWLTIRSQDVMELPAEDAPLPELHAFLKDAVTQGGMDVTPLEEIVERVLDEEKLRKSPIRLGLVTVEQKTLKARELPLEDIPEGKVKDYLLASAACFPALRAHTIDGVSYLDGGYRDNMPTALAQKMGAEELVCVDLEGVGITRPNRTGLPTTLIRSYWELGDILHFEPATARRNIELGYHDTLRAFGRLRGCAYAVDSGAESSADAAAFHAAIIARSLNIPGITQVGEDFLKDCDGREVILNATEGECILDPDAAARQSAITCICEMQRQNEELNAQLELPNRTRDGEEFELLANCFGPEDVGTAMESGASGVGLLRSSYMMMPGHAMDEQEQYLFYTSCLAAARGRTVTVRTFDFGADRTMADAYQGVQSSKLGLRGIRSSLRNLPQMAVQICALMRAAVKGPLRVMFPMVTDIEDWDSAMQVVDYCRRKLTERGEEFEPDVPFGVMLSIPAACLTAEDFTAHGCRFFVIGTNDLTQYTHAVSRELAIAEHYYRPASPAMKKLIAMVVEAAKKADIPVTICGLAVGNAVNATQYLRLGLRSFSMSPQNLLTIKKALRDAEAR